MKILIFLIFLIPFIASSQYNSCDASCENSITTNHVVNVTFGSSNCIITVHLKKTVCGDGSVNIEVLQIESNTWTECGQPDSGVLMIQAIHGLLIENPLNLQSLNQKYIYPSCWRYLDGTNTIAVPCDTEQCCVVEFIFDNNCNRLLPVRISRTGVKTCYNPTIGPLPPGCNNACYSDFDLIEQNLRDLDESN